MTTKRVFVIYGQDIDRFSRAKEFAKNGHSYAASIPLDMGTPHNPSEAPDTAPAIRHQFADNQQPAKPHK